MLSPLKMLTSPIAPAACVGPPPQGEHFATYRVSRFGSSSASSSSSSRIDTDVSMDIGVPPSDRSTVDFCTDLTVQSVRSSPYSSIDHQSTALHGERSSQLTDGLSW